MNMTHFRHSPLHDAIEPLGPTWGAIDGMPVPLGFGPALQERDQAQRLALCDASALARSTLKGPAAADLLQAHELSVPEKMFGVRPTPGGGLLAKTGSAEFFLEDGPAGDCVSQISAAAAARHGVYDVLRQDASILLSGAGAVDVLRQTCGYEFQLPASEPDLVMTRVAGVSCAILARARRNSTFSVLARWHVWRVLVADFARYCA